MPKEERGEPLHQRIAKGPWHPLFLSPAGDISDPKKDTVGQ